MSDAKPFLSRGKTGREGVILKLIGSGAAALGLAWAILTYVMSDSGKALIYPLCLLALGIPVFLAGRSIARAHAFGRG